jgi:hypothetical protein
MALIALRKFLILRRPRSGRLEGRTAPIQPIIDFLPSLEAHSATSVSAARPSRVALRCRRSIRPNRAPGHALTERRMRPVCGMFHKTMLHRVEVRVVQVSRKVLDHRGSCAPSAAAAKCRVRHGWSWPVIAAHGRAELSRVPS